MPTLDDPEPPPMAVMPPAVEHLASRLLPLGWVTDLFVAGSLATGDWVSGVSDIDLVALVDGPVGASRQASLVQLHCNLDRGPAAGFQLGCVYVDAGRLPDPVAAHPTWTHGVFVQRVLSGITRAELVRHGYAVFGRAPSRVLPAMTGEQVREAARAELVGYWAWAARRPWMWLDPEIADLGLTAMARGRHTLRSGELISKTRAAEMADAPPWLIDQLQARRRGDNVASPRLRTALIAWRDASRTVDQARRRVVP